MDLNKEKCRKLKQIRKRMADTLHIDLHQRECTYEGPCSGTCPKCKQEEQQLNQAILKKTALAAGVVTMTVGLTGCVMETEGIPIFHPATTEEVLAGEVEYVPPEEIDGGLEDVILPEDEQGSEAKPVAE
ncbi:MAG: hypothetical protein K2N24_08475 [Lachnospiraceae bacterium]|nr:hypothetical protein [Lachnospiraceae bacterium]